MGGLSSGWGHSIGFFGLASLITVAHVTYDSPMSTEAKLRLLREPPAPVELADRPRTDEQLIAGLLGGDPRAGEQLYDHLIRVVDWTLLRVVGRRSEEHDDLVQSVFEQVVKTIQTGRYSRACSLTSWASAIASNVGLNSLRQRKRDQHLLAAADAVRFDRSGTDVEAQVIARRRLQMARAELANMDPGRAQALILHDVNGVALNEMAAALDISVAAAQSRLSRGRRELSARMARFDAESTDGSAQQPEEVRS